MQHSGIENELLNAALDARIRLSIASGQRSRIETREVVEDLLASEAALIKRACGGVPSRFSSAVEVARWLETELPKSR